MIPRIVVIGSGKRRTGLHCIGTSNHPEMRQATQTISAPMLQQSWLQISG
jgi:hypothetical protein